MASAAASGVFATASLLLISLAVLLILRHFLPLRTTPSFLLIPIFLSLALPASVILLVPIDLASSARTEDQASKGIWLNQRVMLVAWRITYWLTFILTWLVLPLLGEYMDSGYREPQARFTYSLRSNGRYQLTVLGCAVAGLTYITISNGFDFTAVKALVMALAYVWGLILAIYLMGHGLVALPRRMFRNADISGRLRRIQTQAPKVHEKLENAVANLEDLDAQVVQLKQRKTATAKNFQEWIDELVDAVGDSESRVLSEPTTIGSGAKVPAVITDRYLADLSRRLNRARHQKARYVQEWDRIVQSASDSQKILDSKASKSLSFGQASPTSNPFRRFSVLTPYMRYHLHVHIVPASQLAAGSLFTLASVAVVWSEIVKFPAPQLSAIGLGGQFMAALWVCYMCTCALSSVNDVPVWNQRALVRRNTYSESACWYAGQIAKLTVPLSYNFVTFLPRSIHEHTTFYHFLGRLINLTPLGSGFDYIFPIFILLPVCATLFNLYGKVRGVFYFGILDDEDDEENSSGVGTGGWRGGRDLIARDLTGPGTGNIGLIDSPRPSIDAARQSRVVPTRWVPPAERSSGQGSSAPRIMGGSRSTRPDLDPESEEENFVTLFGRRVKNTFEGIDRPKWMQNQSAGGVFTKPKWMNGSHGLESGTSSHPDVSSNNRSPSRPLGGPIML